MATIKKAVVTTNENGLTFEITGGHTLEIVLGALSDDVIKKATLHGLKQKIADSYAGVTTSHEVEAAADSVIQALMTGNWNAGRSSLGGIWVEALARAAGVEIDVARSKWDEMDEETKKDVKKNPAVKTAKAEIDLERAKSKVGNSTIDLDDLV